MVSLSPLEQECKEILIIYKPLYKTLLRFVSGLCERICVSHKLYGKACTTRDKYMEFIWEIEEEFSNYKRKHDLTTHVPSLFWQVESDDNYRWRELWEDVHKSKRSKNYKFNALEKQFLENLKLEANNKVEQFSKPSFYSSLKSRKLNSFIRHFNNLIQQFEQHYTSDTII
jgi:hypothetical protein